MEKVDWKIIKYMNKCANKSKDPNTKVGSVIVNSLGNIMSSGFNGLITGLKEKIERYQRPLKYKWLEHSERSAIFNAIKIRKNIDGCIIYVSLFPCCDCARAIIQSGIKTIICPSPDFKNKKWAEDFKVAEEMLLEYGINMIFFDKIL